MAEVAASVELLANRMMKITWAGLNTGDDGSWVTAPLQDRSVHIEGTAVTTVSVQGSNEPAFANPRSLKDVDGVTIAAAGYHTIKEIVAGIRPGCTTGTAVTFTLYGR